MNSSCPSGGQSWRESAGDVIVGQRFAACRGGADKAVALVRLVDEHDEKARIAEYEDAYRRKPEEPADVGLARDVARRSLDLLAWDE